MLLELLWRAGQRAPAKIALLRGRSSCSLERMCEGGIYDHLGGGFSRYSVDERWLVPHFEKMLYDNAQLLELLALALRSAPAMPCSASARRETVGWLAREMTTAGGRVLGLARCRFRGRGGQVLRLVARPRSSEIARRRRMLRSLPRTMT